jgi:hypothetical protein
LSSAKFGIGFTISVTENALHFLRFFALRISRRT